MDTRQSHLLFIRRTDSVVSIYKYNYLHSLSAYTALRNIRLDVNKLDGVIEVLSLTVSFKTYRNNFIGCRKRENISIPLLRRCFVLFTADWGRY